MNYVYARTNHNKTVTKIGITDCLGARDNVYATSEFVREKFVVVFKVENAIKAKQIEKNILFKFNKFKAYGGGGKEFYRVEILQDKSFMEYIEKYENLSDEEISETLKIYKNRQNLIKIESANIVLIKGIRKFKMKMENICGIIPNIQQKEVLDKIIDFYKENDIGKLNWACGLGKALLSLLIVKKMGFKNVLIGVPSIHLQTQIQKEILKIFPNEKNIRFIGGLQKQRIFIKNNETKFTIVVYNSCYKLKDVTFDFKIGDEAHHLVGDEPQGNGFRQFHEIKSFKTLFMTATEKLCDATYSMDNETIFGKQINIKTVHWAIENGKITDYNVIVLKNTEDEVDEIISGLNIDVSDKLLFISCFMCVKSIEKYENLTHLLLYTNTTDDADLAEKYLELLNKKDKNIYIKSLHSKKDIDTEKEINNFKLSPYGIIPCVFMFGEGFDLPKLNGVCIAANMKSEVRIVQYLLRPNRIEKGNPNKKAFIIIPYIDNDEWNNPTMSYENVRTIISHLRNVDENIEQKIKVLTKQIQIQKEKQKEKETDNYFIFETNDNELHKIKMRLRYSKSLGSKFSEEQDEYNYMKSINKSLNIQSKQQYNELEYKINDVDNYFIKKGVWKDWYDFMGYDTKIFIQSIDDWKCFIKEKKIKTVQDYYELCEKYDILPKEPADFYIGFSNIHDELGFNSRRR
jgi:superfamily II DNA or RNA helicase